MKTIRLKTCLITGTVGALLATPLTAELKAYDGFNVPVDYQHRAELKGINGGTGFLKWKVDLSDNDGNSHRYISSKKPITYTDSKGNILLTAPGQLQCKSAGSGKGALMRDLNSALKGTLWVSFLTQLDDQVGYGWDIEFLDENGNMQFKVMNGRKEQNRWRIQSAPLDSGKPKDGLFKNTTGMTPTDPTLVILKIKNAGSDDGSVTAFLNPGDLRDAELTAMASVKIKELKINAIKTFKFDKKSAAEGYIDELRFGDSVEDVLPWK